MSAERWAEAAAAAALFGVDPTLGLRLRSAAGPARDAFVRTITEAFAEAPIRRLPAGATEDRLLGGLDLTETLRLGRPVLSPGLLAEAHGGLLIVAMAERVSLAAAAAVAAAIDEGELRVERDGFTAAHPARFALLLLDESGEDEAPPPALAERAGLHITLDGLRAAEAPDFIPADEIAAARKRLDRVTVDDEGLRALCATAMALGVHSLRPPLLARRAAAASAALRGASAVDEEDLALAARLVLAPRATQAPAESPPEDQPPPDGDDAPTNETDPTEAGPLADQVLEAALAALPDDLLRALAAGAGARRGPQSQGGRGGLERALNRGRRIGARPGDPRRGARLDLVATLTAAAPWRLARPARPDGGLPIRPDDIRVKRFRRQRETLTAFIVDASGSAAASRLAEAKGAVELLLADCYARRDQVALIAFRKTQADLLLPPTRSLSRAKRELSALPGGGGTPLAAAARAAARLADSAKREGRTPLLVFLTDGGANIAADGQPGRAQAQADALAAARALAAEGAQALVIDIGARPRESGAAFAQAMGARYMPLPRADARAVTAAVRASR